MNVTDYTFLLNKPDAINERQTVALEKITEEFPYLQSARALRLKGLYNEDSFKYNYALKVTAAHTTDRSVLFDFITSDTFTAIQKGLYDQKLEELYNIVVTGVEFVEVVAAPTPELKVNPLNTLEQSIRTYIKEAMPEIPSETAIIESVTVITESVPEIIAPETISEKLAIGKPLDFSREEKHSFQEWLQLSKIQPVDRSEPEEQKIVAEPDSDKLKKLQLIDRFILSSPKIPPVRQDTVVSFTFEQHKSDNSHLMTETLARVYLEQKKYQKAIQAYEILILKYPEKSSFFADRISDIKNLQQNNT